MFRLVHFAQETIYQKRFIGLFRSKRSNQKKNPNKHITTTTKENNFSLPPSLSLSLPSFFFSPGLPTGKREESWVRGGRKRGKEGSKGKQNNKRKKGKKIEKRRKRRRKTRTRTRTRTRKEKEKKKKRKRKEKKEKEW